MPPCFSVVVPAYNAAATLESCLRSVSAQTLTDFELILVDDGSQDATAEIAERHAEGEPRMRVVRQENRGLSAARNAGIAASTGERISFLDSDDIWMPRYLEAVDRRLADDPDAGLVYADSLSLLDEPKLIHRLAASEATGVTEPPAYPARCTELLLKGNFITASSTTATRRALDRVGGFATELRTCEDWDLWLRISIAGYRILLASSDPLVITRDTATSMSKDDTAMKLGTSKVFERALAALDDDSPNKALAARRLAESQATLRRARQTGGIHGLTGRAVEPLKRLRRRLLRGRDWRPPTGAVRETLQAVGEL